MVAVAVVLVGMWGLSAVPWTFVVTCLVYAASLVVVEVDRRLRRPELAWWVTNSVLLPWGGLVILPWALRLYSGDAWEIGLGEPVAPGLPNTWALNLLALLGLTVGTLLAGRGGGRFEASVEPPVVSGRRLLLAFGLLMAVYFVSFVIAGRPLAAGWLLSGEYTYSSSIDTGVSFGFLDLAPTACVALVLAVTAQRCVRLARPTRAELVVLVMTLLVVVGSGVRFRVFLLGFGWLLIQLRLGSGTRAVGQRIRLVILLVVVAGASFYGLGYLGIARSDHSGRYHEVAKSSVVSLDVIGIQERLVARGAQPGVLGGGSYLELPGQFVPRRLTGGNKDLPAAQQVVGDYLDPRSGFSAPCWFEAALNGGLGAVFGMSAVLGLLLVRLQIKATETRSSMVRLVHLVGPAFMLINYQLFSRLLLFQMLITVGSLLVGGWLATRCVRRVAESPPRAAPARPTHPPGSVATAG
ncbi:hypothetical protein AB1484_18980 [Parafrankia sp. FMc6]|uniref:hypothetical protein n=1 Tax=Parafrankia soli TaxID=2599596 RepID=UPI0034D417A0